MTSRSYHVTSGIALLFQTVAVEAVQQVGPAGDDRWEQDVTMYRPSGDSPLHQASLLYHVRRPQSPTLWFPCWRTIISNITTPTTQRRVKIRHNIGRNLDVGEKDREINTEKYENLNRYKRSFKGGEILCEILCDCCEIYERENSDWIEERKGRRQKTSKSARKPTDVPLCGQFRWTARSWQGGKEFEKLWRKKRANTTIVKKNSANQEWNGDNGRLRGYDGSCCAERDVNGKSFVQIRFFCF